MQSLLFQQSILLTLKFSHEQNSQRPISAKLILYLRGIFAKESKSQKIFQLTKVHHFCI